MVIRDRNEYVTTRYPAIKSWLPCHEQAGVDLSDVAAARVFRSSQTLVSNADASISQGVGSNPSMSGVGSSLPVIAATDHALFVVGGRYLENNVTVEGLCSFGASTISASIGVGNNALGLTGVDDGTNAATAVTTGDANANIIIVGLNRTSGTMVKYRSTGIPAVTDTIDASAVGAIDISAQPLYLENDAGAADVAEVNGIMLFTWNGVYPTDAAILAVMGDTWTALINKSLILPDLFTQLVDV